MWCQSQPKTYLKFNLEANLITQHVIFSLAHLLHYQNPIGYFIIKQTKFRNYLKHHRALEESVMSRSV